MEAGDRSIIEATEKNHMEMDTQIRQSLSNMERMNFKNFGTLDRNVKLCHEYTQKAVAKVKETHKGHRDKVTKEFTKVAQAMREQDTSVENLWKTFDELTGRVDIIETIAYKNAQDIKSWEEGYGGTAPTPPTPPTPPSPKGMGSDPAPGFMTKFQDMP